MGPAHSMVVNKTHKRLCIVTFNNADLLYLTYNTMYVLAPGETKQVEAASDPIGLKIGIVYDAAPDGQVLFYQRFQVKNDSVLTVTGVDGQDMQTEGDRINVMGGGKLKEKDASAFAAAVECLTYQSPITRDSYR